MRNKFEIRGDKVVIFLNRKEGDPLETVISLSDLKKANEISGSWRLQWNKTSKSFYVRAEIDGNTKQLHRWLLNPDKDMIVDHINHDTLDNTRENLRIVTKSENMQNQKGAQVGSFSGIRGVTWHKTSKRWMVQLQVDGKKHYLGYFKDLKEAEKVAIEGRKKYMPFSVEKH